MTLTGTVWTSVGPSPMAQGGRQDNGLTTAIAVNPNNDNVIYQGTAGGGVWRTLDGGDTWTPIFDRQLSLGIGEPAAIEIDPTDTSTIYVGTSRRVTPQAGAGLYRSTDGGASCIRLGSGYPAGNVGNASQFFTRIINVIIVDPAKPTTLYMSTQDGVFLSTDRGLNWTRGAGSNGDARSLVLDTSSPSGSRILWAGVNGVGVIRSTDGGQNWTTVLNGATGVVSTALAGGGFNKVVVALAPTTSPPNAGGVQVAYVALSGTGSAPDPCGIFRTTDQGATWTKRNATGMPGNTQGGYSFHIGVDPASPGDGNKDIIYVGCVGQARSTNSGNTFSGLSGLHADTHAWTFVPQPSGTPTTVYCGNDGGLFRSSDNGATWVARNAGSVQTALFYNLAARPDNGGSSLLGALQDNGIQTTSGAASPGWNSPQGGDGWDIAFDGGTPSRAYGTSGFWSPAPCTRVFRSDDNGASWPTEVTPWGTATDQGCYLATVACDPSAAGRVYVSGNQNLWQSQNGGGSWRNVGAFPGNVSVAPTKGNNLVVCRGNQVFVSTNALAPTVGAPNGVTFTDITRNLPNRSVLRAAFDPVDPAVVYCTLGGFDGAGAGQQGHVFRTTVAGAGWENISPPINVPFGGLVLDGTDTPTAIYAGTDMGVLRSVDDGASWSVLDDLHFPRAAVTDLVLSEGGVLRAATYGRGVFEYRRPKGPTIAVNLDDNLDFGVACEGRHFRTLQVFNVGNADLIITSVQRLMGSSGFVVLNFPGTPLTLARGEEIDFEIEFTPTTPGTPEVATIRIVSNDPGSPVVDLAATGTGGQPALVWAFPDDGRFGDVCHGHFADHDLIISNRGPCNLRITGVASSAPQFLPPGVTSYPFVVEAGGNIELPIRFQPTAFGPASATLTITSNEPGSPHQLRISGNTPAPRLVTSIANSGDFGHVCSDDVRDEPLLLSNSGGCALTVTALTSSHGSFEIPSTLTLPLVVEAGDALQAQIRFRPTAFGPHSATITVTSDDPASPAQVQVSGFTPSGHLIITGSGHFGPVDFGRRAERVITLHNTGECDLHVGDVGFAQVPDRAGCLDCDGCGNHHGCSDCGDHPREDGSHRHGGIGHGDTEPHLHRCCGPFVIVSNPFPATVRPGASLPIHVRFTATCSGPACCELVVNTDDPEHLASTVFVTGQLHRTLRSAIKCWAADELQELLRAGSRPC